MRYLGSACQALMLGTHVRCSCWARMSGAHVGHACQTLMLGTHVRRSCWARMSGTLSERIHLRGYVRSSEPAGQVDRLGQQAAAASLASDELCVEESTEERWVHEVYVDAG